jgi:hypothetical protein
MGPNLISVTVPQARRGLLGGRSEAGIEVNIVQSIQDEITRKRSSTRKLTMHRDQTSEESSSQVEEGAAAQRRGRDHAVVVIARREVSVVKIF